MTGILTVGCYAVWTPEGDGEREEVHVVKLDAVYSVVKIRMDDGSSRWVGAHQLERRDGPEAHE